MRAGDLGALCAFACTHRAARRAVGELDRAWPCLQDWYSATVQQSVPAFARKDPTWLFHETTRVRLERRYVLSGVLLLSGVIARKDAWSGLAESMEIMHASADKVWDCLRASVTRLTGVMDERTDLRALVVSLLETRSFTGFAAGHMFSDVEGLGVFEISKRTLPAFCKEFVTRRCNRWLENCPLPMGDILRAKRDALVFAACVALAYGMSMDQGDKLSMRAVNSARRSLLFYSR